MNKLLKMILAFVMTCSTISFIPAKAASDNIALNKEVTSSSYEAESTADHLVVDGDLKTRWGTAQNKAVGEWVNINLGKESTIREIHVHFERNDDAQNITSFKVEIKQGDNYTEVYRKDSKALQDEIIQLDKDYVGSEVKVTILGANGGTLNWVNVGINEIEVYEKLQDQAPVEATLDGIIASLKGGTIEAGTSEFSLPKVPAGFSIAINGFDLAEVISNDGVVRTPIEDKVVNVSYVVTDEKTKESKVTGDYIYNVKTNKTKVNDALAKPKVIPEIQEWYSYGNQYVSVNALKTIYFDEALTSVAEEFIADFENFTNIKLGKTTNKEEASIVLTLNDDFKMLGEEGQNININNGKVVISSSTKVGVMYGLQTILQITKTSENGLPCGEINDYPRYSTRGFSFDVARKPVSLEMIKTVARTMRYYKMNDLQVHLSDNYIFLENYDKYDKEFEAFDAYEAFRLETSLTNDEGESPTAKDYAISKDDFRNFILEEREVGINVVPEIDVPAHSTSFTKVWPELAVLNKVSPTNANRPLIDHWDISRQDVRDKIKELFDDYTKGDNPVFDSETVFHIGADEFLADYKAYREFCNEIVPYVKETNTVRMWGGYSWIKDNPLTEIIPEAIEGVQMNIWSSDWASGKDMYEMGFDVINTIDTYGYMVPNGNGDQGAYADYLNITNVFNNFETNELKSSGNVYYKTPSGDDQMLGAMYAVWSDNIDKSASGLTESDLFTRIINAMPVYAEKTWASNGKAKGTINNLMNIAATTGLAPNTDPYYSAISVDDLYAIYDFESLEDTSDNNRDLTNQVNANVKDGVLTLLGNESYVETPLQRLGNGNALSFDITLTKTPQAGDILFESDFYYGSHDLRILSDGSLGFTRELYEYTFNYELPVGRKVNIRIETAEQKTTLYVDGVKVSEASGSFIHNDIVKKTGIKHSTFALPLTRIGSKTQAIKAIIDNVVVEKNVEKDPYNKAAWSGSADTETIYSETEGKFVYAFDGKANTIWHSNWQGASDKLNGSNSFTGTIDMGQAYEINTFMFTPRQGQNSGQITKASVYVKANEADEWIQVADGQTFKADQSQKAVTFATQKVRYIKFVALQSNDGWVAVSEFDVANRAASDEKVVINATAIKGSIENNVTSVEKGTKVTLKAKADSDDLVFAGWYHYDELVSEELTYTFNAEGHTSLVAKFMSKKDILAELIEEVDALVKDEYTKASYDNLVKVNEESKKVLNNTQASASALQQAIEALTKAKDALEVRGNKAQLKALYATNANLEEGIYTVSSWANFKAAYEAAKKVIDDVDATQSDIDNAKIALTKAINDLTVDDGFPELKDENLINKEPNSVTIVDKTSECTPENGANEGAGLGSAIAALDKDDTTYWHSHWGAGYTLPQSITVDLGATYKLSDVTFLPRNGRSNGDIYKANVYVSDDATIDENDLVGTFTWDHGASGFVDRKVKRAYLGDGVSGRYVRFEAIETYGPDTSNKYATIAEINFYGSKEDEEVVVDKMALNTAISEAEKVNKADYTDESVKALDEALSAAKAVLANEKATQDEVDAAAKALTNAISALVKKPVVNKAELEKAIKDAEKVDTTNKTAESIAALTSAITSAKEVLADDKATQAEVDAAVKAINAAVANLKDIEVKPEYKGYDDVDSEAWYAGMVQEATIKGLMGKDGSSGNNFNPDGKITRGMVATVLYRMAGEPKVTYADKFSDVKDGLWYSNGIVWASEAKVVSGYANGKFGPDDAIKREDFAIMLRNYANTCGLNTKSSQSLETFKDYKAVSAYAKDAIAWCVENGLMSGSKKGEETYLNPSANTTRAEAAKMFVQLSNLIKK